MSVRTEDVDLVGDEMVENLVRAALFATLVGAGAYVAFPNPLSPAPVTLQVLAVFLTGLFLGPVWGGASLGLYLLAGAAGAPIFHGGSAGVGILLGPTAGYLWAFPIAVVALGIVVHGGLEPNDPASVSLPRLLAGLVLATAIIYTGGVLGGIVTTGVGPVTAVLEFAVPFVPMEFIKIAAAIGIVRSEEFVAQ